jgi:putative transport protein
VPEFLLDDTIALVLLVVGVSAAIGSVRLAGVMLGPAAALFVGLAVGALDDSLAGNGGLAVLREFGLVLFTYTVGVASGPNFVAGFRRGGMRAAATTVGLVVALAGMCALVADLLDLSGADRAGLFAGSTTNTPSLQAAVEATAEGDPVIAYSLTYPAAIASMLVVLTLLLGRRLRVPARFTPPPAPPPVEHLVNWTIVVDRAGLPDLGALRSRYPRLNFSRIEHAGTVSIATLDRVPSPGDAVVVVGPDAVVEQFCGDVGHRSDRHLPLDRATFDFRRILVSDRRLAGKRLGDLDLLGRFGVTVTRLRRGDDDLLARDDMELQLGDRLRVVGPTDGLAQVARTVGDSERGLSELDAVGFAIGIAAGLLLGMIAVPLLGGVEIELGAGGGALVAGLVLGALARTGPVTWQMPRATNLVLRQLGILMFLACAGLASGATFTDAVTTRAGFELLLAGGAIAATYAALVALVAQVVLRQRPAATAGTFAGVETQPAALAYAADRAGGDERVNAAYALVFPVAMIVKIVAVQFLV